MRIKEKGRQVEEPAFNKIIGKPSNDSDCEILFSGRDNILLIEDNCRIDNNTRIRFAGDNALVYLGENTRHAVVVNIDAWSGTTVYIGRNTYFSGRISIITSERENILIGDDGIFAFGVYVRTADPHIIYDGTTGKRLNQSKSVFVGDHVWIGQNALILKGSQIGSGSILAAGAVCAGKRIESNSTWGGNPVKRIKSNIFWTEECVHNYGSEETKASMTKKSDAYMFNDVSGNDFNELFANLTKAKTANKRLDLLKSSLINGQTKHRFSVKEEQKPKEGFFSKLHLQ